MAWISVHQQIRDHRKTRELFRELKISRAEAIGTLILIWTWAIDNCGHDGEILSATVEDIANAAYWSKGPQKLYDALVKTHWIDEINGNKMLHDWYDFNKPFYDYISKREKDRQRKRDGNSTEIPRKFHGNNSEGSAEFQASPAPAPAPKDKQIQIDPPCSPPKGDKNDSVLDKVLFEPLPLETDMTPEVFMAAYNESANTPFPAGDREGG